MAFFSILKRRKNCVYSRLRGQKETPIYEMLRRMPYIMMWSQLYAQFQAINCRCNSLAFVCIMYEVVMLRTGSYMKRDKFHLSQFSWDQSADVESLTIDCSKSCNKMFSLRIEEDVRSRKVSRTIFSYKSGTFLYNPFFFSSRRPRLRRKSAKKKSV